MRARTHSLIDRSERPVRALVALLLLAFAVSPAISLSHDIEHLEGSFAAHSDDSPAESPEGEADAEEPCFECGLLAGNRAVAIPHVVAVLSEGADRRLIGATVRPTPSTDDPLDASSPRAPPSR